MRGFPINVHRLRNCTGGSLRAATIATCAVLTIVTLATNARAAESPHWEVSAIPDPTNLVPGSPRDEVQQVTVRATGGTFTLRAGVAGCNFMSSAPLPYDASAGEVQSALEALPCHLGEGSMFPPGSVALGGGSGGAHPYTVTFAGKLGDRPIKLLQADGSQLTGDGAGVSVTQETRGTFVPELVVSATNVGGASTDGSTITLADTLPAGLTATAVSGYDTYKSGYAVGGFGGAEMSCQAVPATSCTYAGDVIPGDTLVMTLKLAVDAEVPSALTNGLTVSGGGAPSLERDVRLALGDTPATFGPAPGSVLAALSTSQAGAHPNVTTNFALDTSEVDEPVGYAKDIRFDLPPGLVGTAVGMPRCAIAELVEQSNDVNACPADTMVGMATFTIAGGAGRSSETYVSPVYNIAPAPGEPVAFAFFALLVPVRIDTSLLSNGDYGVRVTATDLPQQIPTLATSITIWGVPADHSGPGEGISIYDLENGEGSFGGPNHLQSRVALLDNPQQCSKLLAATLETDQWSNPGAFLATQVSMGTLSGCEYTPFSSSFTMLPDTLVAGGPAGYTFDLSVPQSSSPQRLATANVKDVKVALPAGTVVNPSAGWGLRSCSDAQFALHSGTPGNCPREAQIGTVEIRTPDLALPLQGEVYLGEPECDPCTPADAATGRMVRLFVQVVGEGESGVVVKLEGHGQIDQADGRITTFFENEPQLPFNELKLTLGGGPRAVLANPRVCGPARSELDLTPWSSPFGFDSTPFSEFEVNQACFGPHFSPSFTAGSTNVQAGAYSLFTLAFGRGDRDEMLERLRVQLPPGLLGMLSHVELCAEPQAREGTCGPQSLIGHVQVLTGPGADPFLVTGGQVFITGPYGGAPYGLSIVVPAVAGPYTLAGTTGKGTVVVRSAIAVDPEDAHLTVTSDPLPSALDGIPLQLRTVSVTIDRPGFTFNPTSCAKLAIAGALSGVEGASAGVASPFQVTNCADLAFKPVFQASTAARTSRAGGTSLDVRVRYPSGAAQANIAKVRVELPKRLPSRLKTLQQACIEQIFARNPAACPPASRVGEAIASTPVLAEPLRGPAYFVSHGGAKFPELVIVLQGDRVTVDLHGETFINRKGITSSTFDAVPDVPVSSFELKLPEGSYSALAANGNLCKGGLTMPTTLIGHNGATIHQRTKVAVSGCPRSRRPASARRPNGSARRGHAHRRAQKA